MYTQNRINHTQKHVTNTQIGDMVIKVVCCYDDRLSKPVQIYRGENAVYEMIDVEDCKKTANKHFS